MEKSELMQYVVTCEQSDGVVIYKRLVKDPSRGYWLVSALSKNIKDWSPEYCLDCLLFGAKKRFKLKEWNFIINDLLAKKTVEKNGCLFSLFIN